jgi:hypothetical protein
MAAESGGCAADSGGKENLQFLYTTERLHSEKKNPRARALNRTEELAIQIMTGDRRSSKAQTTFIHHRLCLLDVLSVLRPKDINWVVDPGVRELGWGTEFFMYHECAAPY